MSKQRFDRAILIFLRHFKSHIDDRDAMKREKLHIRLSEILGPHDHLQLLNLIVEKIATNLKCYTKCKVIIDETLSLFMDMASIFKTGEVLQKLEIVRCKFLNHQECFRNRTTLFYSIGLLMFMENSHEKFNAFMEPFLKVFSRLQSDESFLLDHVKYEFIGLMRDLRGIAMSANSPTTYGFLFGWLYPHMPILLRGLEHYANDPQVTTPLLKFVAELVLDKSQYFSFHFSPADGICLFREVSGLIVKYGSKVLKVPNIEASKYKGISICLTIIARALSTNLVQFEILELYHDKAYSDALDIIIKLVSSIPLGDIFACQKFAASYFTFLETISNGHLPFVLNLDDTGFKLIIDSLELGIKDLSKTIPFQCTSAIDNLGTFHFNHSNVGKLIPAHADRIVTLSSKVLRTLFEVVVLEDHCNLWTFSRAILSMMILVPETVSESEFTKISKSFPPDRRHTLLECFKKLFTGVPKSLDAVNMAKFYANLTRFKSECCMLKPQ